MTTKEQRDALIEALGKALEQIEILGAKMDEFTTLGRGPAVKAVTYESLALLGQIVRADTEV